MSFCPLCGRKYVKQALVVRPPTKEEVLAAWRAKKRADKAGPAQAVPTKTVIPAARVSEESTAIAVAPRLLTAGAAAMFVGAFVLGESVMALNLLS